MSKKAFKSQASSARAASSTFGSSPLAFGAPQAAFQTTASPLSYITELPDLNGISNPQIVVAFKNLGKKDSTTKAKALEELQEHLSSTIRQDGIETAVLEAWASLYPRTSIDSSRRVRQLSHTLQGSITASSGKRSVPYLPKVIGSWLAGTHDSDKGVVRAAQDALQTVFTTPERTEALWKVYRQALMDYVEDAMLVQSQQTLSDERTTSPDDSEAKHVRVVSTAALVLLQLIERESSNVSAKHGLNKDYAKLLRNDKLWEYAYHKDASMRRAVYALTLATLTILEDQLDFQLISTCFLAKALPISQLGSSLQYVEALLSLTQHRPQLWTTDYTSKTPAGRRLLQFLKKGSQRGPESYWTSLGQLIRVVPEEVWSSTSLPDASGSARSPNLKDSESLLEALHEGVINAEEPRQNVSMAWSTHIATALWLVRDRKVEESQILLERQVYPIVQQSISKSSANPQWDITVGHSTQICARILVSLAGLDDSQSFVNLWSQLCSDLEVTIRISSPESSKGFTSSQDAVIARATRHFKVAQQLDRSIPSDSTSRRILNSGTEGIISTCAKVLRDRKGKPYGAAGTIAAALSAMPEGFQSQEVDNFIAMDLSSLLASPSAELLLTILLQCSHSPNYHICLEKCTKILLGEVNIANRDGLLMKIIRAATAEDWSQSPELTSFVRQSLDLALKGDQDRWKVVNSLLSNEKMIPPSFGNGQRPKTSQTDLADEMLSKMINSLSIAEEQNSVLLGFEDLFNNRTMRNNAITAEAASQLLPKLLLASDSPDEDTAKRASDLSLRVHTLMKSSGGSTLSVSTLELLQQQFEGTGQLLSVFGMVELAELALRDSDDAQRPQYFALLFPSAEQWQAALAPFVNQCPPGASAITSPLQGTAYVIEQTHSNANKDLPRDSDDFSIAMRLALYVTKLLSTDVSGIAENKATESLYLFYPQVLQLINDKLTMDTASSLWLHSTTEVIEEAADAMSKGQKLLQQWTQSSTDASSGTKTVVDVWQDQFSNMKGTSSQAYLLGLCFNSIMTECMDRLGPAKALNKWKTEISSIYRSDHIVQTATLVSILQDVLPGSAEGKKLYNELIADATGIKDPAISVSDLRPLILLNLFLQGDDSVLASIPTQRVVFLFQNLVRILASSENSYQVSSEIYKLLCHVVMVVSDIYGEYWEQILDTLASLWESGKIQDALPVLHSSLSLYARLRSLLKNEPNEDLVDAWKGKKSRLDAGLLRILKSWSVSYANAGQPRNITADSLTRQLRTVDIASLDNIEDLCPLLASEQHSTQTVAYELLNRAVPARQEQISLDVALEKKVVHLPAELMSMIATFPSTAASRNDLDWRRCYLLSWTVLFDNFTDASFKLKEMYHTDIKSSGQVPALLDTICSILRIASGRPVDGTKFDVTQATLEDQDLVEKEAQSIAVHLYYISLLHIPDLVKEWFIEQKNRIKSPLESWTQKHISPLIITASLKAAADWAAIQDQNDRPVSIKASPRAAELVASIAIDEESPPVSLAISLPGAYPLEQAIVTSRNRVGVSDKNWQSWMRTFQIIIFSSGNLIEGLIAFRRNVQGALKGQTECAICYSIIGTDMKTPDKRCGTCKNTFHSVCLFRWFKSSNSSSCPLCRNNFNYA